ncbi:MAG TPA: FtsQ-type POTRA domain-containing protein [Chthoniobacterales bacterium]
MRATTSKKQPRAGNRRLSTSRQRRQQHLLDVRVRAQRVSHHRNRRVLIALSKVVLVVALIAGAYYGLRAGLRRFFFDNPDYRLNTIAIRTDGTLQREQVLKAGKLEEGSNIFTVNLAAVHERIQQLAQVDEVQVERKLPNEIDITITERKPIAWITSEKSVADPFASDAAFLVDARGTLMKEKKLLPEYLALPLITGCSEEALDPGKTIESFEARAALELLRLTTTSFMQTRFQIREIDLSKGYCLVVTDKNHAQVTFGFDDLEEQMARLEQFLVYSDDSEREIATVNLLVARNTPVTFAQPAAEVIEQIEPPKSITTKTTPNETRSEEREPEIRKARPVQSATPIPVRKALPYSPGVKKFHANPASLPVRKAIPLQRFKQEGKPNG